MVEAKSTSPITLPAVEKEEESVSGAGYRADPQWEAMDQSAFLLSDNRQVGSTLDPVVSEDDFHILQHQGVGRYCAVCSTIRSLCEASITTYPSRFCGFRLSRGNSSGWSATWTPTYKIRFTAI